MSFLEPNTDGMIKAQTSHVEHLQGVIKNYAKGESQLLLKGVEDERKANEMANEIEELKNALGQLKQDHAWAQRRIEKGLAVCANKDKEIERLKKFEEIWRQTHGSVEV
jgi:outer membrane murein-binding lipoprotein Lpp